MLKRRITAFIMALSMLATAFVFSSCSGGEDKTIGNAYVSVYVYNAKGTRFIREHAVKVTPNENHEHEWGRKNTAYLALETVCAKENKNKALELITDSTGGVTIEKIDTYAAGVNSDGDPFYWVLYINDEIVEDGETRELQNTDKVEFKYIEQTYRSVNVKFSAKNGAVVLFDDSTVYAAGEKEELTITNVLNYKAVDTGKVNKNELGIMLSEDGKTITKVGDVEVAEGYEWAVFLNDEKIEVGIDEQLLKDGDVLSLEYRAVEAEETGATTDAVTEAQ